MTLEIAERGVLDRLKSAVIGPTTRVGRLSAYFMIVSEGSSRLMLRQWRGDA